MKKWYRRYGLSGDGAGILCVFELFRTGIIPRYHYTRDGIKEDNGRFSWTDMDAVI